MSTMAGHSDSRRVTSSKTYSRRVNKKLPVAAARKNSEGDSSNKETLSATDQRRALAVSDENQNHALSPQETQQHSQGSPLSTTSAKDIFQRDSSSKSNSLGTDQRRVIDETQSHVSSPPTGQQSTNNSLFSASSANPQRQVLSKLHLNKLSTSNPWYLLEHSQTRGQGASQTTSQTTPLIPQSPTLHTKPLNRTNKGSLDSSLEHVKHPYTTNSALQVFDKGIVRGVTTSSPPETRQNEQTNPIKSSHPETDARTTIEPLEPYLENEQSLPTIFSHSSTYERPILDSPTPDLDLPSNKRRHHPDTKSPDSKKVKRSSIKSYFKPLPPLLSPPVTRSMNIFSDEVEAPSSPPTSPISGSESPKYRPFRKKPRRNLSLKPSLPPVIMDPKEEPPMSFYDVAGNMDDDSRVELLERLLDTDERLDQNRVNRKYSVGDPFPSLGVAANIGTVNLNRPRAHSSPIDIPGAKTKPPKYEQLRLNTSSNDYIVCKVCNFMYNETIQAEVQHHAREHKKHTQPQHPANGVIRDQIWEKLYNEGVHRIHVNQRRAGQRERAWYEMALEIAREAGLAGSYDEEKLWDEICIDELSPQASGSKYEKTTMTKPRKMAPRYKVYVYTINYEVVSVALAQRITKAGSYYHGPQTHDEHGKLESPHSTKFQQYVDLDRSFPVQVSIDCLCTAAGHQRKGYATTLLDQLRQDFIWGVKVNKKHVAISFPTADGAIFAREYFKSVFEGCPFVVADEAAVVLENGMLRTGQFVKK